MRGRRRMRVLLGAGESQLTDLTAPPAPAEQSIPRSIWSALCQKRHLRESSRPSAQARAKLDNPAISGAPEDQLRAPLERLFHELAALGGLAPAGCRSSARRRSRICRRGRTMRSASTTRLSGSSRSRRRARAATRANSPTRTTRRNGTSSSRCPTSSIPTATASACGATANSQAKIVPLEGDVETSGAELTAPRGAARAGRGFPELGAATADQRQGARADQRAALPPVARRGPRADGARATAACSISKEDWRKLLFPDASDAQFADGYAQAVTFGLLMARAFEISLKDGVELAAIKLRQDRTR